MADQKITALTLGTPQDTDVIPFVDLNTGTTKKATKSDLKGDKGDKGDTGSTGATGSAGADGSDGADGADGASAYVYIAYASDSSGTSFTTTFDASLNFIAIKETTSPIASPSASDFTGLWKNYKGATGATGAQGPQGDPGADGTGTGDMLAATYDPNNVADDAFAMDNMVEGTNTKILTSAERTKLSNTSGTNTGDQTSVTGNAGTATKLATARNIDGQAFDGSADITVIAPGTHAATGKTTPVNADELPIVDSAASNVLKKLTWANLKATLKTYFDGIYQAAGFYITDSSTDTLTNKTLTTPIIAQINGTNNKEVASFVDGASTVNFIKFSASSTGNGASIQPDGSDSNVELLLISKGTKAIKLSSGVYQAPHTYTPSAAGTATVDLSSTNVNFITMPAGNITIAVSNANVGQTFIVRILQDGTGSRTVTWFTTIKWATGTTPTLTTTASKADMFGFVCTSSGNYDGFVIGQNI